MPTSTNFIFATLTYRRDKSATHLWRTVSGDTNRFMQRFRRTALKNGIQYLRAIEMHKDKYPHVHLLICTRTKLDITNQKYFSRKLYQTFKSTWTAGLSDFQVPRHQHNNGTINYILKYISKSSSSARLWKLISNTNPANEVSQDESSYPIRYEKYASHFYTTHQHKTLLDRSTFKYKKHRYLTWSDKFPQLYKELLKTTV